ncbi:MAG TPA: hypothetical protein VE890_04855 [Thermoguttaceae bacterium]|nr:hypothetical protein [Thermoguttaceae bacterium]
MNHLIERAILLADANRWSNMSQRFQGQRTRIDLGDILTGLLVLGTAIAVFWLLSLVIRLQDRRRTFNSPVALFVSLCRAHRLRWSEGWLLWRVAREYRLRDPAQVFVRPALFDPAKLGPSLQQRAAELKQLGGRLFAEPEEDDEEPQRPNRASEEQSADAKRTVTSPSGKSAGRPSSGSPAPSSQTPSSPSSPLPPALDVAPWPPLSGFEQDTSRGG